MAAKGAEFFSSDFKKLKNQNMATNDQPIWVAVVQQGRGHSYRHTK